MKVSALYVIVEVEQDCSAEILRTKFSWRSVANRLESV